MKNLMDSILKSLWNIIQQNQEIIITALIAIAIIGTAIYILIPRLARLFLRMRHRQTPELQKLYISLLSNGEVIELYEPSQRYIENLEEEENKPKTNAWLSPYSRAVKASIRRRGRVPKSQYFNARRQIREASKHIKIRQLNEDEKKLVMLAPDSKDAQFAIELSFDGHAPEKITNLEPSIKTQLGLIDLIQTNKDNPIGATYIASKTRLEDPLVDLKIGEEFFKEYPAKNVHSLPMAKTTDGTAWNLPTHHTLIYGTTGSGKSGPLFGTIQQLAPFVEKGFVQLYGIDPKASDLRIFEDTTIFEEVVYTPDQAIAIINDYYHRLDERGRSQKTDLDNGKTNRAITVSKDTPLNILMIDELFDLRNNLMKSKEGKAAWANLENVFAKGRSLGFYVMAASQFAEKEHLQNLRNNIGTAVILRQPSPYLNDLFLGADAAKNGFDSTAIPLSNQANGYKYSGIGYVQDEGGTVSKVRFAYIGDEQLINLIKKYKKEEAEPLHEDNFLFVPQEDPDELPDLFWK